MGSNSISAIGPGAQDHATPAALAAIADAELIVGYTTYIRLVGHLIKVTARDAGHDVARVHTGDPLVFGSTAEQMSRLKALEIPYEVVPGVSSFTAAAVLGRELTLPELCQTVILSRAEGRRRCPRGGPRRSGQPSPSSTR